MPIVTYPTSLCASDGVTPLDFHLNLWRQKTTVPGLSHGVVYVILGLAVFVELRLVTASTALEVCRRRRRRSYLSKIR